MGQADSRCLLRMSPAGGSSQYLKRKKANEEKKGKKSKDRKRKIDVKAKRKEQNE